MEQITCMLAAAGAVLVIVLLYAGKEEWRGRALDYETETSEYLAQLIAQQAAFRIAESHLALEKSKTLYWQRRALRLESGLVPPAPVRPPHPAGAKVVQSVRT